MSLKDFTLFNKSKDDNSRFVISSDTIVITDLPRTESAYHGDSGYNAIGDFVVEFEMQMDNTTLPASLAVFGGIADREGDWLGIDSAGGNEVGFWLGRQSGGSGYVQLGEVDSGIFYSTVYVNAGITGKHYYPRLERIGSFLNLHLFTDSGRTVNEKTLTLTLHNIVAYDHIYGVQSYNNGVTGKQFDGFVKNYNTVSGFGEIGSGRRKKILLEGI